MRGFEEIQKIVKNFVEESKQAKQQIIEIENERNNLAQERNRKKEANIEENLAEVNELGKQISKLGNQSQELQNKLDKRFLEVKKLVNLMIDNQITEEMRKIRKINEIKEEYIERVSLQEERNARYEMQKQEFFERFGRMPELSENAKQEDTIQDKQCLKYKEKTEEKEIITFEEKNTEKYDEVFNEPVVLSNIMVKIENNELVYKAQASNGEEVSIKPTKLVTGNALLKIKEEIEKVKEILINYAVVEYKPLDKSVIKKIDPLVCELLNKFANKYNYDAEMLIYNYAMSFAKNEMLRTDFVSITYNIAYIDGTNLSKLEKREITKICKKAFKNENVDIIGRKSTFSGIKYIFKRLFAINNENRLPEGKY